jgi:tRNA threonylcarbamoyladenosine biosynthesis protein TsaB
LCKAQDAPKAGNLLSAKADAELTPPRVSGADWFGVGSGFASDGGALSQCYAGQLSGVDSAAVPHAAAIASLGAIQFSLGLGLDAALAQPFYLRDKVALKTHEREQLAREKKMLNA